MQNPPPAISMTVQLEVVQLSTLLILVSMLHTLNLVVVPVWELTSFLGLLYVHTNPNLELNMLTKAQNTDENGHGTHCSGTIGGSTYGVAKAAKIVGVKVLDASGSGTTAGVISGIQWVATNHVSKSVLSMSLGGGFSSSLNSAVASTIASGVTVVVAAGNDNVRPPLHTFLLSTNKKKVY